MEVGNGGERRSEKDTRNGSDALSSLLSLAGVFQLRQIDALIWISERDIPKCCHTAWFQRNGRTYLLLLKTIYSIKDFFKKKRKEKKEKKKKHLTE